MKKILITGSAGFIGFHMVSKFLHENNTEIFGLDIINNYYDVNLKYARLYEHGISEKDIKVGTVVESKKYANYKFIKVDLAEFDFIVDFMIKEKFDLVVNLAAQAGVRYSIDNPRVYLHSNINGFLSILEGCRYSEVKHLVYASTSSVYGLNTQMPLSEKQSSDHPISLYSATKKSNELMAHAYSHLFKLPTTGLRFFTVYGPWGRPDMALFLFAEKMLKKESINLFNYGNMYRDFTYIDDIVESVHRITHKPPIENLSWDSKQSYSDSSSAPYRVFNIGNSKPIKLIDYVESLELALGVSATKKMMPMQLGDVPATHADTRELEEYILFKPSTSVNDGVALFAEWYINYYASKDLKRG